MDFSKLKKKRGSISDLQSKLEKESSGGNSYKDDRFWMPSIDKAGNGFSVIRFLPTANPTNEDPNQQVEDPYVKFFEHGFQGPGGWYIEKSLTSIGKDDPVSEYNSDLWNSGIEANKEIARKQKRKLIYVSNVYIVDDPSNPENNGKVFLFKYGKKIFEKIKEAISPQFADEQPIDPFDLWEGADFKLKIRKVDGYRNYDKSEFCAPSVLGDMDDEGLETIWRSEHDLYEFIDPKEYKSYEELKTRLEKVLKTKRPTASAEDVSASDKSAGSRPSFGEKMGQAALAGAVGGAGAKALMEVDDEDDIPFSQPSASTVTDTGGDEEENLDDFFAELEAGA